MSNHPAPEVQTDLEPLEDNGIIARITVVYPSRLNILNTINANLLRTAFEDVSTNENIRVVVLTGAGDRSFIGGADIKEFAALDPPGAEAFITNIHSVCQAIRDCPVPVIARINGYCLGAGLEVAAACDLRVAVESAVFGMPEVKVGVPSVIEAALLPRLIGWGKTNELLLTGENISAQEAAACGLIDRLVGTDRIDEQVGTWTRSICEAAPKAVRLQKELIRSWETLPLNQAIDAGIASFRRAFESNEPAEYSRPFLTRKNPPK